MTAPRSGTSIEQQQREKELLERVVHSFAGTPEPRLKQIMESLVRHLHGFLQDVRLTEDEWSTGIRFLTEAGHATGPKRQEFILLSDILGASMQTIGINNEAYRHATEATVLGPFYLEDSPEVALGGDTAFGAPGEPCWVEGTVTAATGAPVAGARLEVWEADSNGLYDVQYGDDRAAARAHLFSDQHGRFAFWALTPTPYPIPHDGPAGRLLEATGRSPLRAPHLHFRVTAPGLRQLVTHIFVAGDGLLARDSVFGVKASLVKEFDRQPTGTPAPGGRAVAGTWTKVRFDIVLAPAEA